jgi:uncharacterized membrane protein
MSKPLGLTTVGTGLLAGLMYGYSCSVMPGLAHTSDRTFVSAMQHINRSIQNPVFFATFLGAPALNAWAARTERATDRHRWILTALGLNALAFAITIGVNVPLNDALARAAPAHATQARAAFERPWLVAHTLRTLACTGAFGCLVHAARVEASRPGEHTAPPLDQRSGGPRVVGRRHGRR